MKHNLQKTVSLLLTVAILSGFISTLPARAVEMVPVGLEHVRAGTETPLNAREKLNFNQGWKFTRNYVPEAINPACDIELIKTWENVDLPHTARLEPYINSGVGKLYQGDAMYVKYFPLDSSYTGKKLYVKFEGVMGVTDVWVNGTHMTTKLAQKTGSNTMYGGYLPFIIDISDVVKFDGTDNMITVYADSSDAPDVPPGKPAKDLDFSYFGGIYRDVWLEVCSDVHITNANFEDIVAGGGILVDYPEVSAASATIRVDTHIRNEAQGSANVSLTTKLVDKDGATVATNTAEKAVKGDETFQQTLSVANPKLWNLDTPYMHTLVSTVTVGGVVTDKVETPVGIRKIEMDRSYGLKINGKVLDEALYGVNRHQEYAYLGYAASSALQRRDAIKFKEGDVDVVRTGHYPPSEDFLAACDELGILVIEPTPGWQWWRNNDTFKSRVLNDIRQMIRRDRNRPCILAYETVLNETGAPGSFTQQMAGTAKEEHPSAKVATEDSLKGYAANAKDSISDIMYKEADRSDKAVAFQREYGDSYREQYSPSNFFNRRVARGPDTYYPGGEGAMFMQAIKRLQGNQEGTFYYQPKDAASVSNGGVKGTARSYLNMVEWDVRARKEESTEPVFIGSTSWIGIDHNRSYDNSMAACGLWDLYRIPKFSYYAQASQRNVEASPYFEAMGVETGPMLFVASYWTSTAPVLDKSVEDVKVIGTDSERLIIVYSNAATVKLQVMSADGTQLWTQTKAPVDNLNRDLLPHAPFEFEQVPYTAGSYLVATGYTGEGVQIAQQTVRTAGAPAKLALTVDNEGIDLTADGSDAVMVHASVLDTNGTVCDTATDLLKFSIVSGDAKIVGDGMARVGANPIKAEAGMIGAYIQAGKTTGEIVVKVESAGLESAQVTIQSKPMTEKAAAYTEIAYTGSGSEISGYLADKERLEPEAGTDMSALAPVLEAVTVDDARYPMSIKVYNNMEVRYDLHGKCERLKGQVYVLPEQTGQETQFLIYVDGVLKYASPELSAGELAPVDISIAGGKILTLVTRNKNASLTAVAGSAWLNLYVYEGTGSGEEELGENLALSKVATATSSIQNTTPAMAVDGDVATLWIGDLVHDPGKEITPQDWTVDLGQNYNVRNAKVGLLHDSIGYTYKVYTASAEAPDTWTLRVTTTKSSQASEVPDYFTAKDVRYVKVHFADVDTHADRGQYSNAAISEFAIYRDTGVASAKEYELKGLSIEGKNLVFDSKTENYTLKLQGFETSLRVRALPFDTNATVTINGYPVTIVGTEREFGDIAPITLTDLGNDNNIVVAVTAASGGATKTYTIHMEGTLGNLGNSNPVSAFVKGSNGADGWYYEQRATVEATEFTPMTTGPFYVKNGEYCYKGGESYQRNGPRYVHPGTVAALESVRTFVAPKAGQVLVSLSASLYADQSGAVQLSVLKNGTKVWPEDAAHAAVNKATSLKDDFNVELAVNDRLQFVLSSGGSNASDATCLETHVSYWDDLGVAEAVIAGPASVSVINGAQVQTQYTMDIVTEDGIRYSGTDAIWTLPDAPKGVTVSADGRLTVTADATAKQVVLQAESKLFAETTATLKVKVSVIEMTLTNVALNKPATALKNVDTEKAVNGIATTTERWSNSASGPAWWQVDLQEVCYIDTVSVFFSWHDNNITQHKFDLMASMDGKSWKTVGSYSDFGVASGSALSTVVLPVSQSTRYLKVDKLEAQKPSGTAQYVEIGEFTAMGSPVQYNVTVSAELANGTVTASPDTAAKNTTVTVTAEPESGYRLKADSLKYYATDGGSVETGTAITKTENMYSFVMPSYDVTVTAEFETVPAEIKTVTSVDEVQDISVAYGTAEGTIGLPATIDVTFNDGSTDTIGVTWASTPAYSATTPGAYAFTGTLAADPSYDTNSKIATCTVTVQEQVILDIISVATLDDLNVAYGMEERAVIAQLPTKVTATLENDATVELAVEAWTCEAGYEANTTGRYDFTGALTLVEGVANSNHVTAQVTVVVGVQDAVAPVAADPAPGVYTEAKSVVLTTDTEDAVIYYTTDGSQPSKESAVYAAPISVEETTTIKALATKADMDDSAVSTFTYTINLPPVLDKKPIDDAIAAAESAKSGISISDSDPSNVSDGTKFVSTAVMKALTDAIQTATAAKNTVTTAVEVNAAAKALNDAVETFHAAIQEGSYVAPSYTPPSNTTTTTEKNPDGSTTKTVRDKTTGTVTETTTYPNGNKTMVESKKDGTVTEKITNKDGYQSETVTKSDGSFTSTVKDAEGVKTETTATAVGETTAKVTLPKNMDSAKVTVPVKDVTPGTVAVIVKADGTEEIIKASVVTDDGVKFVASENVIVKLVDNTERFADVEDTNWAADAIAFATSRELFNGTSTDSFSPAADMSRAMLVTVLARLNGEDTSTGDTWDTVGVAWAKEQGISDGSGLERAVSCEQLVVMLYRYAKAKKTETDLTEFNDIVNVSSWASEAMAWAVESGIITGKNGALDPQGNASRAEVATMLERFVGQMVT